MKLDRKEILKAVRNNYIAGEGKTWLRVVPLQM
jgi:hypothetical protein